MINPTKYILIPSTIRDRDALDMLVNDHETNASLYEFICKSFAYLKRTQKKVLEKKALGFCIHKRMEYKKELNAKSMSVNFLTKARYDSNTNLDLILSAINNYHLFIIIPVMTELDDKQMPISVINDIMRLIQRLAN